MPIARVVSSAARRPLKSRQSGSARRLAAGLAARGVAPNTISMASMVFAALASGCLLEAAVLTSEILQSADKYWNLRTESARQRHANLLRAKGIPLDLSGISVHGSALVWSPYFAGMFHGKRGGERIAAVDAVAGRAVPMMGHILTQFTQLLRET